MSSSGIVGFILFAVAAVSAGVAQGKHEYRYVRLGNPGDSNAKPTAGFALMGGGSDLDEAFQWLCKRSNGGDFLVLRASGSDDYNPYVKGLCPLNSAATLVIPNRGAAVDPFVGSTISHASAIFLSGGDQANYINFWTGTPVQAALNDAVRRGVPIGGTSAGLAVLGEFAYSAQGDKPDDPNLDGKSALAHPDSPRMRLVRGFIAIPILKGIITDTHFAKRDRMGRLLAFLARLNEPDGKPNPNPKTLGIRGIGVEERAAVLLEPNGKATVAGFGDAYFVDASAAVGSFDKVTPLTFGDFTVQKVAPGKSFDLKAWQGEAERYSLSVKDGEIRSTQFGGSVY